MEQDIKTRFGNLKYNHFKVEFKGLIFELKLCDDSAKFPNSNDDLLHEQFKVYVTYKDKTIDFYFYNSAMEREISNILRDNKKTFNNWTQIKGLLKHRPLKMWGGYDKDLKNNKTLEYARIRGLLYSVVHSLAFDMEEDLSSFSWWCSNFGYDEDSRNAEGIYKECQKQQEKIISLNLPENLKEYLREYANQETEQFQKDINKAVE